MLLMSDFWSNFCCLLSDSDSEVAADPVATTCTGELRSVKKVTACSQESFSPGKTLNRWFMDQSKSIVLDKMCAKDLLRKVSIIGELHDAYT